MGPLTEHLKRRRERMVHAAEQRNTIDRARISITASQEIACFGGMVIKVFDEENQAPHFQVWANGQMVRVALPDGTVHAGEISVPYTVVERVREWLATEAPGSSRLVGDLVYDQWLRSRNKRQVEPVPTPDEIKVMTRPKKAEQKKKSSGHNSYYTIERIETLPDCHLKVWFNNGDVKIVDVKAMRGDSPPFKPIWDEFDKAEVRGYDVAWPVIWPDGPNTVEILAEDIWGAGVDVRG